jgi:hypothetical protein
MVASLKTGRRVPRSRSHASGCDLISSLKVISLKVGEEEHTEKEQEEVQEEVIVQDIPSLASLDPPKKEGGSRSTSSVAMNWRDSCGRRRRCWRCDAIIA